MFTVRRIFYALAIVLLHSCKVIGTWFLLFGTIVMLAYSLTEWQWKSSLINSQHVFNEVITYLVCLYLLLYTNFVTVS